MIYLNMGLNYVEYVSFTPTLSSFYYFYFFVINL